MKLLGVFVAGSLFQVAAAITGGNWPGFKGLRYFFAFGDSYTTVGFNSWASVPTDANPLGVSYPGPPSQGSTTSGGANYIGFLGTRFNASRCLYFDYAVSGNEVAGVNNQVNQDFLSSQGAGNKPSYAPWTATNSLFSTFIGINDLNRGAPIAATINTLFNLQETLYNTGARNFLFINVPPTNRCPFSQCCDFPVIRVNSDLSCLLGNNNATLASLISSWNTQLKASGEAFQAKHSDVAVFYYDSWSLYTKLLDNPVQYGFTDIISTGGDFWIDTIHPRSKVHQYMAEDLANFLASQTGNATNPATTTATSATAITTSRVSTTTTAPASTVTGVAPHWGQW
ncbi:cellulose-binding GDSL lipase/acylhydrolase, putative [Rhizoctonia solani AG-3 Rhs1AP]|uniref:Cellulose-binding GDSL lipase/acylhydrolase, putative n=1 Tax=Rhizoctonia solani AG-3 Rhs1AP TaxID=1086054 RepID=X8JLV7_9AGAM|nr:cellulose-binding GDSL lipase/acylhydrolase, putative [Rhizoctonia solani AG-3 Rhs1AP]